MVQYNPISLKTTLKALSGSDDKLLFDNPDRGFRTELCLLIKEKFPEDIYLSEGLKFDTEEDAEKHKVSLGPGYVFSPIKRDDGTISHYIVKYTELNRSIFCDRDSAYNRDVLDRLFRSYFKLDNNNYRYDPSHLVLSYLYLTDFHNKPLSKNAFDCIKLYFQFCRERKVKNMLRISYNWEYLITHTEGEKNKWLLASECADFDTIDLHTKQLCDVIGEYKDTIHSISNGFVGFVGEWAWHYQWPEVDYNKTMMSILQNICVPNNLYFSARLPKYRYDFQKAYPEFEYHHLVSLNNDAFYGEQEYESPYTTPDGKEHIVRWNSSNYGHNIYDEQYDIIWWDYATDSAYMTPQDGEMYVQQVLTSWNMRPYGYDVMLECAHHRHTSLSYWHGYLDTNENPDYAETNIMTSWQNPDDKYGYFAPVNKEKLEDLGIIYDPDWLYDENGKEIQTRNAYDFIRDHLGYRIKLLSAELDWSGVNSDLAKIVLKLKNFGFSAAFNLTSKICILNSNYNLVSECAAGDPSKWISLPKDYYSKSNCGKSGDVLSQVITHRIDTQIKMPLQNGKYFLAIRIENSINDAARLANKVQFIDGYNIITDFVI